jgi:hypothetical protein
MPSPRYTVRLPSALDAAVQEHIRTSGTPFATLIRDALSAYLADILPTPPRPRGDQADRAVPSASRFWTCSRPIQRAYGRKSFASISRHGAPSAIRSRAC